MKMVLLFYLISEKCPGKAECSVIEEISEMRKLKQRYYLSEKI